MTRILVIDDEAGIRESLDMFLREKGFTVRLAKNLAEGMLLVEEFRPQVVILDLRLPDGNGLDVLKPISEMAPYAKTVVITAFHDMETTIEAMRRGAYDYIHKPIDVDELDRAVDRAARVAELGSHTPPIVETEPAETGRVQLVGRSSAMKNIFKTIGILAGNRAGVLIEGETGTGKELIARTIHRNSAVFKSPFVAVNCTALPESLLESELFGHVRGAFTGANNDRRGRFEMAGNGTIFLDEIGDTTEAFQAKLLRVLQNREFFPVGAEHGRRTEARVVAATNKDLRDLVAKGEFREDLYFRLKVVEIRVPPLRERRGDIAFLVRHILSHVASELNRPQLSISAEAMADLLDRPWPGNVRELENVLMRAAVFCRGPAITPRDLAGGESDPSLAPPGLGDVGVTDGRPSAGSPDGASLEDMQRRHVQRVLIGTAGNKSEAARILQISRPTLHRMIRDFGLYTP
jgi:two-component system response regulator AtoC